MIQRISESVQSRLEDQGFAIGSDCVLRVEQTLKGQCRLFRALVSNGTSWALTLPAPIRCFGVSKKWASLLWHQGIARQFPCK